MSGLQPWYRQGWPWFLILLPLAVVIACMVTLYLALETDESLVRDDYYEEGLAINRRLEEEARARELGIGAELRYAPATLAMELRIDGATLPEERLVLSVVHPTDHRQDQSVTLQTAGEGLFLGKSAAPIDGKRYLLLEHADPAGGSWRLRGTLPTPEAGSITVVRLDAR
jgi:uncharacterized protein